MVLSPGAHCLPLLCGGQGWVTKRLANTHGVRDCVARQPTCHSRLMNRGSGLAAALRQVPHPPPTPSIGSDPAYTACWQPCLSPAAAAVQQTGFRQRCLPRPCAQRAGASPWGLPGPASPQVLQQRGSEWAAGQRQSNNRQLEQLIQQGCQGAWVGEAMTQLRMGCSHQGLAADGSILQLLPPTGRPGGVMRCGHVVG